MPFLTFQLKKSKIFKLAKDITVNYIHDYELFKM